MFCGPNGSGKTTIALKLERQFLGNGNFSIRPFVNADEFLAKLRSGEKIDFSAFGVTIGRETFLNAIRSNGRLASGHPFLDAVAVVDSRVAAPPACCDAYVAGAIADVLREQLLVEGASFSFETVMSHPGKVDFFARARQNGYRTYLYFVATESPVLNVQRIMVRSETGGHGVPIDKVSTRYERSLSLVGDAIRHAFRAYFFDNSGNGPVWVAQVTPRGALELKVDPTTLPVWFKKWVSSQFPG